MKRSANKRVLLTFFQFLVHLPYTNSNSKGLEAWILGNSIILTQINFFKALDSNLGGEIGLRF